MKASAMARSEAHANEAWSRYMLDLVRATCLSRHVLSSDDVFALADSDAAAPTTHDTRAFGPVMRRAALLGYCKRTNYTVCSVRESNHYRPIAVWESLICRQEAA
ncbi:hypothetical protein IVA80_15325 [Bradyrhizobium sp. 139]|uniref:hypothetical protein n=1 Tax=Bradyrhizobium sp. 139 TaxID=2782616 RepID=UPI001FFA0ECE|nr:hypothetical protein [Bradyrhizobium sp. 139]MCK1742195.1 hypothetical protein [Bradyrhizobium sp. 139]